MKRLFAFLIVAFYVSIAVAAPAWFPEGIQTKGSSTIGEKSTAAASSVLDIRSTTKGMLPPRMTTAQRTAIASPATGLLVYDTDTLTVWQYNGTGWVEVGSGGAGGAQYNVIENYNFEDTTYSTGWTVSGGTLAAAAGTNILFGTQSATWDSSSAGQTLSYTAITIGQGYKGNNCEGAIYVQTPSGTATHLLEVYDGTNVLVSGTVITSATARQTTVNFPCPSSGTMQLRLKSVAADEPLIAIDDAYLGLARNVGSTQLISEETSWTPTGSWTSNATYTGKKRQNGDRIEYQVNIALTGAPTSAGLTITLPSSDVINTSKLATGTNGYILPVNGGEANGTNRVPLYVLYNSTTSVKVYAGVADQPYLQTGNQVTQAVPFTWANGHNLNIYFSLPIVGLSAQTVVMPNAQGWYVDASISGANVGLGTTSVSSYSPIGSSSLTMTKASGSADVMVPCNAGNAPSGLTCSAGSELFGAAFNIPKSGAYRVCLAANHYIDSPAGSINVVSTFQLVETSTTSDTILQEGKGKAMSGSVAMSGDRREYRSIYTCGDFVFSSVGQKVVKLMYETEISGTPDNHYIKADGDTILGQPDVHITVYPLQDRATAILANSVSSANTNGTYFNSSQVGSTGTVSKETGDWISGSCSVASAVYTCTLVAGAFSTDPACHATIFGETTSYNAVVTSASTSSVVVRTFDTANAAAAADFALTCSSPR